MVVISIFSYLIVTASRWLVWDMISITTYEALSGSGVGALMSLPPWLMWLVVLLQVAAAIGMYRFNLRARFVFAALAGFHLVALLFGGVVAHTAFEIFLATWANLINGAIIALAYLSPVRRSFAPWPERRAEVMREREIKAQRQPTALDNLSVSLRIQALRQDYVAAAPSRPHHGIYRSRLIRSVRDAILRMSYFRKAEAATSDSAVHETQNHAA